MSLDADLVLASVLVLALVLVLVLVVVAMGEEVGRAGMVVMDQAGAGEC